MVVDFKTERGSKLLLLDLQGTLMMFHRNVSRALTERLTGPIQDSFGTAQKWRETATKQPNEALYPPLKESAPREPP